MISGDPRSVAEFLLLALQNLIVDDFADVRNPRSRRNYLQHSFDFWVSTLALVCHRSRYRHHPPHENSTQREANIHN